LPHILFRLPQNRIFDLLDEREFNKDELLGFFQLLFGEAAFRNAPDIHEDWNGFVSVLQEIVKTERNEWNLHSKKMSPLIDLKQLNKVYGDKKGFLGLFRKKH
jgi:hypothetical protein